MPGKRTTRSIVAVLLVAGVASFIAVQQAALYGLCPREILRPANAGCYHEGAAGDPHLDRRQCHVPGTLVVQNDRLPEPARPATVKPFMPKPAAPPSTIEGTVVWNEPLVEWSNPRAPPRRQPPA